MQTTYKLKAAAVAALVWVAGGAVAQAQITIPTVTVGNPGNAADTATGGIYGSVNYSYEIGKYEVTNAQYAAFLNAVAATDIYGLYNINMGSQVFGGIIRSGSSSNYTYSLKNGYESKPVGYLTFWDAARFANWLNNGQGNASTEVGSYNLGGVVLPENNTVNRNAGANWVVPSENEWYKAAFYDPAKNGGAGGYWQQATRSDTLGNNSAYSATNGANYYDGDYVASGSATFPTGDGALPVGSYPNATSPYGTLDQAGNVSEWNDTRVNITNRGQLGGAWLSSVNNMRPTGAENFPSSSITYVDSFAYGFRVAYVGAAIPEPSTYAAMLGGLALAVVVYRRRGLRSTL